MHFSPAKRCFGVSGEFESLRSQNQAVAHFHSHKVDEKEEEEGDFMCLDFPDDKSLQV